MRSADGFGASKLYLTGYSPYPRSKADRRLPHEASRVDRQIKKTALGAEESLPWEFQPKITTVISKLKKRGVLIVALELAKDSKTLASFKYDKDLALVLGNEVLGIDKDILQAADVTLQIPMKGRKESFNVASAAAIALYHFSYIA